MQVAERKFPDDAKYEAKEDETPRIIAKLFGVDLQSLVKLNKLQYPTLTANARLRKVISLLALPVQKTRKASTLSTNSQRASPKGHAAASAKVC